MLGRGTQGQGDDHTTADSDPEAAMETAPLGGSADSVDSLSPRSTRGGEPWDEPSAAANTSSKLRLMCSYGGHIGPRPHDKKTLCYLGGETRIVVVDRHSTLADLHALLSRSLLGGRPFSLKYQLPSEDLDSLISVATDEDVENMVEEYDRVAALAPRPAAAAASRPARLRLFIFPVKPESAELSSSSIGSLLDDSNKSETWFFDALNGAVLHHNHSSADSAASSVDCLLGLDNTLLLPRQDSSEKPGGGIGHGAQDVQSMPDSPMIETASSFGSASSAPSLSSLPPIHVRPDDRSADPRGIDAGLDERFSQMNVHGQQKQQHQQPPMDVEGFKHHLQQFPAPPLGAKNPKPNLSPTENPKSSADFSSSDDKLVQRSPQLLQHFQQPLQGQKVPENPNILDLPLSGDAVSRTGHGGQERPPPASDPKQPEEPVSDASYSFPVHVTGQGYLLHPMSQHAQQQQNANQHLSHNLHATTVLPIPSYYHQVPMHPQQQLAQAAAHAYSPQLPVYFLPVQYNPAHNLHAQPKLGDAVSIAPIPLASKPTIPPPNSAPPRVAPAHQQELSANVYQTGLGVAPALPQPPLPTQLIHVDQSHQYVRYHPLHRPASQSGAAVPVGASYGYEYGDAVHAYQAYYTQATAAAVPTQYQMVSAGAVSAEHPLALQQAADANPTSAS